MLSEKALAFGKQVIAGLLGVDRLCRLESGDEVGLAVLNMDTEGEFRPEPFETYDTARRWFEALRQEASDLPEPDRRRYYDQLCHSTLAFTAWRDCGLRFESQLADFLHVPPHPATGEELDRLKTKMRSLLTKLGYRGGLSAQSAAWEERNRVPAAEVPGVLMGLMDEAWDRTDGSLLEIPAPKSDGMQVVSVTGVPFNARCDYLNRTIELNIEPVLTRPSLKHLAVHEGYPGHYVQFKLRETMYREGTAAADVLLSVVNSASSSVFEGIGDAGMEMINWVDTDDDRVQALMNRYRAGIGTVAAWQHHALDRPESNVRDWLRSNCLTGGEGWVANRMQFIGAPSRAALIWSYWHGEPHVSAAWRRVSPKQRPEFLRFLYGRMHSTATIGMFPPT